MKSKYGVNLLFSGLVLYFLFIFSCGGGKHNVNVSNSIDTLSTNAGWHPYENAKEHFSLYYPNGWSEVHMDGPYALACAEPFYSNPDNFAECMNVIVYDSTFTEDSFIKQFEELSKSKYPGFKIDKEYSDTNQSGNVFRVLVSSIPYKNTSLVLQSGVCKKGSRLYSLTASTVKDSAFKYIPLYKRLFRSVKLL